MDNELNSLIVKKLIQKALLNELCRKNLIDFSNANKIIKEIYKNINNLKSLQENNNDMKNIIVKIRI